MCVECLFFLRSPSQAPYEAKPACAKRAAFWPECCDPLKGEGERQTMGSGQVQCTSRRNFAPFSSSTFRDIQRHSGERAGKRDRGGSAVGARYMCEDTTQTVLNKDIKRARGCCPWSPTQEGARDQSSSMRRGLPSKGEARALHHQPAPALTFNRTMSCFVRLLLLEPTKAAKACPNPTPNPIERAI